MPRSGKAVRLRLQHAAVELFLERGYDQTTTQAIAARAGVTERTYFRHFADKREVLFDGESVLIAALRAGIDAVPPETAPLPTLLAAFRSAVPLLEGNRSFSEPRARIIATAPALQERAQAKTAALIAALVEALQARGVDYFTASLCATIGMGTFALVTSRWMDEPTTGLGEHLDAAFRDLRKAGDSLA